ncbi:MAG TPA: YaaC family protein [Longimicrobium sp.]|nr:YaaC family protein [Longimicrobium sp.]
MLFRLPSFESMPPVARPREGEQVRVKGRPLQFSFWPMFRGTRRPGLQSRIFATNPWALISASIRERCPAGARPEALASIIQAESFYKAATEAGIWAAKPLLTYYSLLNLAKAYALTEGLRPTFEKAQHGLTSMRTPGNRELLDSFLRAFPSPNQRGDFQLFDELLQVVSGRGLQAPADYPLTTLLPQIVPGHRIWCEASGQRERFVSIEKIEIMESRARREIWLRLSLYADDLTRLDVTHATLMNEGDFSPRFREITPATDERTDRRLLRFEEVTPTSYRARAADELQRLVSGFQNHLWATVLSVPPYRKYYLYLSPAAESAQRLPQLVSIYAVFYYLGSLTRYRPQFFDEILQGAYGQQLQEILTNQPGQFLYLMASEFARREVTRAAIV